MLIRVYLAPQLGNGSFQDPYRSLLNEFVSVPDGETFDEIDNPARRYSICVVYAKQDTHDVIAADTRISVLSPLYADAAVFKSGLDAPFSSWPQELRQLVLTALDGKGINTGWITLSNTPRDVYRVLLRVHALSQIFDGTRRDLLDLIRQNLDTKVSQIPAALRTAVSAWMQSRGLAIGWITNQTTVREILHFIVQNLGFGQFRFYGELF